MRQAEASSVPSRVKQGAEARDWSWVEASVWADRMVSALENGVKGGRWFSLIDKVYAPATLSAAWARIEANGGAAGVDGQSIARFAAQADLYLTELSAALREGRYRPQPIRRVEIPKGISDGRVLDLLRGWLTQDILQDLQRWTPSTGTPQGAVISPLLANIYLHPLDVLMAARGYRMVRYADDFVVLCKSREEASAALAEIQAWVGDNGLRLQPDKTHLGDCRKVGEGFEFLGYRFEAGRRWVRNKSLARLKDSIRSKTRRTRGDSLACVIDDLNPMLCGWFGYFKHAHRYTFTAIDGMVRRRLRAFLRKQAKRPGFGHCLADHRRWPNAFFAKAGLFSLHAAWLTARCPR